MIDTQILAASVRTVRQVSDSFKAGANVVTLPPATFEKMYKHILTDAGLAQFEKDWAQVTHHN
jgi:transaldolase